METACIIVLYEPQRALLEQVISSISAQVSRIVLVDNTPTPVFVPKSANSVYIPMSGNQGIAAAQNRAIEYLITETNCQYVLFLDQDSIAPECMVAKLQNAYQYLQKSGIKVGGVVAKAINRQNNKTYHQTYLGAPINTTLHEVREMMNSASFIGTEHFKNVGLMDATLFIDGVDWEWCWRAKERFGLRFFLCNDVALSHCLGQGDKHFVGKSLAISSPFRMYYQYRNYIRLCGRNYVPGGWKIRQGIKYLVKMFYYPIFVAPRAQYLSNICRGIKEGFSVDKNTAANGKI